MNEMVDENEPYNEFQYFDLKDLKMMLREVVHSGYKEDIKFIQRLCEEIYKRERR